MIHQFMVWWSLWALALPVSVPVWRLQLVTSVRPPESSATALGTVTGLALLPDGSVYVAERSSARVSLYGRDGALMRVMMRAGEGPGETREPEIAASGDTLIVYDGALDRLSRLSASGHVLEERRLSAGAVGSLFAARNGTLFHRISMASSAGGILVDRRGRVDTMRWQHPRTEDLSILWNGPNWDLVGRSPYSPLGVVAFDPLGRVVVGGSRRSRWFVIVGSDTVQTVGLPDVPVVIPPRVRDSVWQAWYASLPTNKLPHLADVVIESRIPKTLPPWVSFDIDAENQWWIGRPGLTGVLASWDIASNGRIVGHLAVPAPVVDRWPTGPIMTFANGRVAMLHEDLDGVPWVGVYRVLPGASMSAKRNR
ncbi:MAG TPA: hypothetical protein VGM77_06295 [Gemmatimonadales bacterium]|jgi:hypothetical protein